MDDVKVAGAITGGAASLVGAGSVTIATITAPAPGILGVIGLTTTTTVALPVAGVVAAAGLVGFGIYKGVQFAKNQSQPSK
ncbi:hypothetical protein [Spirulina sp. 06S082]|uniref:hypothetical protein n=1 Tax=Spirulina sp. 06S082 TaxID=3110248 RepID=UPI002B208B63|nr:hypothetical protein [Spirulina sp. 06S082]MEA5472098.1 hypothetical protein [Spirulina sp. 06S082]